MTIRGVNKIINHYSHLGTLIPFCHGGSEADVVTNDALHCNELIWKLQRPSIYAREIENRLLLERMCYKRIVHQSNQNPSIGSTIETINEIKFPIINSFIHSWQKRLGCFDLN